MNGGATANENVADPVVQVLDTTALLALRGNERGADRVERALDAADKGKARILLSFMTRMELSYLIQREEGESRADEALRLVDSFPITWVTCEPRILTASASLKARGRLSVADSWIAATAQVHSAVLIHRDPDFAAFRDIEQEFLGPR